MSGISAEGFSASPARRVTVGKVIASLRLFALPISVISVPMVTVAAVPPGEWRWDILIATTAGVAMLHLAGNLLNDYFDYFSQVDQPDESGDAGRPGRLLVRGELLPRDILVEAAVCLLSGAVPAGYLMWRCGPGLLAFGAVGLAGLYAYTGPPFKLKSYALGELTMFVMFGPALGLGTAFVQTGRLVPAALWVSLAPGLATAAVLTGNNFRDRDEDGRGGVITIARFRHGAVARIVYFALAVGAAVVPAVLAVLGMAPKVLLAAPLTVLLLAQPFAAMWRWERQPNIDALTARYEAVLLLMMLAAYALWPVAR